MKPRHIIYAVFPILIIGCGSDIKPNIINRSDKEVFLVSVKLNDKNLNAEQIRVPISKKNERNYKYINVPSFTVYGGERLSVTLKSAESEVTATCDLGEKPGYSWSILFISYNGTSELICTYDWG